MADVSTILIRLDAPIQSWGDAASRWDYRTTGPRPTKSGLIGLVANALGRDYGDPIDDLASLRFAVRADRPGHTELDFRVAGGGTFPLDVRTRWDNPKLVAAANGRINYGAPRGSANNNWTETGRSGVFRTTTFLVDAAFVASLTGDTSIIDHVRDALEYPARAVFLGRRAHPPAQPLHYATLLGDHHTTWPTTHPLLDNATTTQPHTWTENVTGTLVYEQPASLDARGGPHLPLRLAHTRSTPPAHTGHLA